MSSIVLRRLSKEFHQTVKVTSATRGTSMQQYIIDLIQKDVAQVPLTPSTPSTPNRHLVAQVPPDMPAESPSEVADPSTAPLASRLAVMSKQGAKNPGFDASSWEKG